MLMARRDNRRVTAAPHETARCEICDSEVIAKCGQIVIWHWAHKSLEDCDPWAETVTHWHTDWQNRFPSEQREVPVGAHRADILLPNSRVIEFQHSAISVDDITAREQYYADMIWVFDAVSAVVAGRLDLRIRDWAVAPGLKHCSLRWRHPRRSVFFCHRPVFFDIGGDRLLHLRRLYPDAPYGGWGTIYPVTRFLTDCAGVSSLEIGPETASGDHDWASR